MNIFKLAINKIKYIFTKKYDELTEFITVMMLARERKKLLLKQYLELMACNNQSNIDIPYVPIDEASNWTHPTMIEIN